jgi:hypothetical protein
MKVPPAGEVSRFFLPSRYEHGFSPIREQGIAPVHGHGPRPISFNIVGDPICQVGAD